MASINPFRRWIRKNFAVLRARPLPRDADFIFPRIIWKTKLRGKTVIWKTPARAGERQARQMISGIMPEEGNTFYFRLSKRYPDLKGGRRWEEYYDLPSLKNIFDGTMNRRVKKILRENKLTFEELLQKSMEAKEEVDSILSRELNPFNYNLDFGPDQLLVGIKNRKIDFILVDI
ncbi:MAG: hypothetical protein J4415_03870 [Candidatus Diapherotrites archaeon]|uniref:Uncharacterized protein n=1 Tax=Candidatus Iainarchaeum sp. TaxID=3101447 RepID=A0A8T4L3V6_9ARCH|nr:hypothetical protein [Candidatus Diapherotrites archaeon]